MIKKLLAVSIFVHLALSKWWVDKNKATHIAKQISSDNMIKAYLTIADKTTEDDKPVLVHTAVLHLIYSTPLVNKTSAKWEVVTWNNRTFLFTMEIPKEGIVSMNTHITDADYKKFVLLEKKEEKEKESTDLVARAEGDEVTTEEEKGITKEERDKFLNSLVDNSDGALLRYQESNVKGSFKLEDEDEDDNCQFAKYIFNNGTNFVHLPVLYCDLYRVTEDDAKRQEEAKKALKGYKAEPSNAIVIPNMSTELVTLVYTRVKEEIDRQTAEKAKTMGVDTTEASSSEDTSTEASSSEDTSTEKTSSENTSTEKTSSENTSSSSSSSSDSSSSSSSSSSDSSSSSSSSSGDSSSSSSSSSGDSSSSSSSTDNKEASKWYKSGWFIALIVIFVVLVITGIVLTVLMVGNKDKTLDYTS